MNQSKFFYRLLMAILFILAVANIINGQNVAQNQKEWVKTPDPIFFSHVEETFMENTQLKSEIQFFTNSINGKPEVSISIQQPDDSWEESRHYISGKNSFSVNSAKTNKFNKLEATSVDIYYLTSYEQLKVFKRGKEIVAAIYQKDQQFISFTNDALGLNLRAQNKNSDPSNVSGRDDEP